MKMFFSVLVLIAFFTSPTFANLIQNGSFETGFVPSNNVGGPGREEITGPTSTMIPGWSVGEGNVFISNAPTFDLINFKPAQDGENYLDLSGRGPPHATVYQDFATNINDRYSLKFYIGSSSVLVESTISVQVTGLGLLWDTALTPLTPNQNNIDWLEETFVFTANSTTTRLSFVDISISDDNASFIDNVSVSPIPEPTTLAVLGIGSLLLIRKQR